MTRLPSISEEQIKQVITGLGLEGTHDNDFYIAQYHINHPELVGSKNYLAKIEDRKRPERDQKNGWAATAFLTPDRGGHAPKPTSAKPVMVPPSQKASTKPKPPTIKEFADMCDEMLCDMENGDFAPLIKIKKRHADTIKKIIMCGVAGGEQHYDSMAEMKKMAPDHHKIYTKLTHMFPAVSKPKDISKLVNNLGLPTEINGTESKAKLERLYDEDYNTFVFFNVVSNKVITVECDDVKSRWKGKKTLVGKIKRFTFSRSLVPKLMKCVALKSVLRLNVRKVYDEPLIKISPNMVLVKAFK